MSAVDSTLMVLMPRTIELFNLLINPISHDFALRWHRDDVKGDASLEEEKAALALWNHGIQWNTALYEDACLYVVPGSHSVPRTPEQRMHSTTMDAPADPLDMPGAIPVALKCKFSPLLDHEDLPL